MNSERKKSRKEKNDEKQKNQREDYLRPMENVPDSLHEDFKQLKLTSSSALSLPPNVESPLRPDMIFRWINDLLSQNPAVSDLALQNLAKHNKLEILPLLLWESPCTVTKLLQEVIKSYARIVGHIALPFLPQLNIDRLYNILRIFQCIACHPETRPKFLKANMPHYFYPLMDIDDLTYKPHECLRFGALCVIGYLLKPIDRPAIRFLMDTDAFRYCIKPIEFGSTESKTVAVTIFHKILSTDEGLQYFCEFADRFFIIDGLLKKLLLYLSSMTKPFPTLLNLVVNCYFMLSQNSRALEELRRNIPVLLFDGTFTSLFAEDSVTDHCRMQLSQKLVYKNHEVAENTVSEEEIKHRHESEYYDV